jgi:hypothetical protein
MFETYRMLGEQRELELLREARRLHAGQAVRRSRILRTPQRRLLSLFGSGPRCEQRATEKALETGPSL